MPSKAKLIFRRYFFLLYLLWSTHFECGQLAAEVPMLDSLVMYGLV